MEIILIPGFWLDGASWDEVAAPLRDAGEVPLPDWSAFGEEDLVDLDDDLRDRFRSIAIPEPVAAIFAAVDR